MRFVLNRDAVNQLASNIYGCKGKLAASVNEVNALDPGASEFDFTGAIKTINTNILAGADKLETIFKYILAVTETHTDIQSTTRFEMPNIELESAVSAQVPTTSQTTDANGDIIQSPNPDGTEDTIQSPDTTEGLTPVKTITVPEGNGTQLTRETGWELIGVTNPEHQKSRQYRLRQKLGDSFHYDEEGFGKANGRYLIACTQTFGEVGDYIDFTLEDGTTFPCIIADSKGSANASRNVNDYGHKNGAQVLEFIVDSSTYNQKGNPGEATNHPEWNQRVVSATNYGNKYF